MPGNRFPLPVEVGGEPDVAGPLGKPAELRHRPHLVVVDDVGRGEVVVEINARNELLLPLRALAGQVADVADRGLHDVAWAEVFLDRLRLGGALDDDELVVAPGRLRRLGPGGGSAASGRGVFLGHDAEGATGQRLGIGAAGEGATIGGSSQDQKRYPAFFAVVKSRR